MSNSIKAFDEEKWEYNDSEKTCGMSMLHYDLEKEAEPRFQRIEQEKPWE